MVGEEEGAVLPTGLEICRVGENGIPQPLAGRWPVLRHVEAVLSSSTAANNDVVAPLAAPTQKKGWGVNKI